MYEAGFLCSSGAGKYCFVYEKLSRMDSASPPPPPLPAPPPLPPPPPLPQRLLPSSRRFICPADKLPVSDRGNQRNAGWSKVRGARADLVT